MGSMLTQHPKLEDGIRKVLGPKYAAIYILTVRVH